MSETALLAVTFLVGAIMAVYLPMIGTIGKVLGSSILACLPFFSVGLFSALVLTVSTGQLREMRRLQNLPPWLLLCGVAACAMIIGTAYLIPRIGASRFFVMLVAGQLAVGAAVAHFGLLNSAIVPFGLVKGVGMLLVVTGAFLVVR